MWGPYLGGQGTWNVNMYTLICRICRYLNDETIWAPSYSPHGCGDVPSLEASRLSHKSPLDPQVSSSRKSTKLSFLRDTARVFWVWIVTKKSSMKSWHTFTILLFWVDGSTYNRFQFSTTCAVELHHAAMRATALAQCDMFAVCQQDIGVSPIVHNLDTRWYISL